jgi:hypothetical protein
MIRFLDEDKESDVEEMNTETKPLRTQDVEQVVQQHLGSLVDKKNHRQAAAEAERTPASGGRP